MVTRREFLRLGGSGLAALAASAWTGPAPASYLGPSPFCEDPITLTKWRAAGKHFRAGAPNRMDLSGDVEAGPKIELFGTVFDRQCNPIEGARIDVWHADRWGAYDMDGHRLRAHQITGSSGTYGFITVIPQAHDEEYPHFHFRVLAPGGMPLFTQVFLPIGSGVAVDPSHFALEANWGDLKRWRFDFVVAKDTAASASG